MNENTKEVYALLQDIFRNVWEQQKYSEVKNGILLTINIAIFVVLVRVYFPIANKINNDIFYKISFYILMIGFIIHILLIIQSYFPKDKNIEDTKWSHDEINIFFFGDILKINNDKYLNIVIEKSQIKQSDINKNFLSDLTNQIIKISEITQCKYDAFKDSITRMYVLGLLFVIYFTLLFFNFI